MLEVLQGNKDFYISGAKLIISKALPAKNYHTTEQNKPKQNIGRQRTYAQVTKEGISGNLSNLNNTKHEKLLKEPWSMDIWEKQQDWIKRSIVGELREFDDSKKINSALQSAGMACTVRYIGGLKLLITFKDLKSMTTCHLQSRRLMDYWFRTWFTCPANFCCKDRLAWIEIRNIPIKAWNNTFFRTVGNNIGRFVGLSKCTASMERMDRARIMVATNESSNIPNSLIVNDDRSEFKIKLQLLEWIDSMEDEAPVPELSLIGTNNGETTGMHNNHAADSNINGKTRLEKVLEVHETTAIATPKVCHNEFEIMMEHKSDSNLQSRGEFILEVDKVHGDLADSTFKNREAIAGPQMSPGYEWVPETQLVTHNKHKEKEASETGSIKDKVPAETQSFMEQPQ